MSERDFEIVPFDWTPIPTLTTGVDILVEVIPPRPDRATDRGDTE